MPYTDPITKLPYPSKEWMFEHWETLPEVQKAYPEYATQQKEAPETLIEPKRESFATEEQYQTALQKFKTTGQWATPAPPEVPPKPFVSLQKEELPFPTTQEEMKERMKTHTWDPRTETWKPKTIAPPTPPTPPKLPPTAPLPPTNLEQSLMNTFGITIEQTRDPSFIKSKIGEITEQIKGLEVGLEKENAILDFITMASAAGVPYSDIQKYMASLAEPVEPEEDRRKRIYTKYGISELEEKAFATPTETFESIYKRAYEQSGLADIKEKMREQSEKIEAATTKYNEAVGEITDNPWLIAVTKNERIRRAYESYERKISSLQNEYTRLSNEYERGQERAESVATRALSEIEKGKARTKEELSYYITRAEADIEAELGVEEEEEAKELYRYFPEYIKSLAKEEGTPQLKQLESGEWAWIYPSGKVVKTGETGKKTITSEERTSKASKFLEDKKGKDGLVSAADYVEAQKMFIAMDGSRGDFEASFPIGSYLGEWEWPKLPENLRPKVNKEDLKPALFEDIRALKTEAAKIKDRDQRREYENIALQLLYDAYTEFSLREVEDYWDEISP